MMIATTAMQFVGSIYQGEAEGARLNSAADLAESNARNASLAGNAREEALRRRGTLEMGRIRASAVQTGFDANTGSLADLQASSAAELELNALTSRYESQLQSISFQNEAAGLRSSAKSARRTGVMNAFGSLMSSGANYFGQPRIGLPAPVESRTPTLNPNYTG